jgi:phosphoglycerate dehydrogenase-like enzyme
VPADDRPAIAVLCATPEDRPTGSGIDAVAERAQLRFTDAAGLPDALDGASALFLWDFFSSALRDAWPHARSLTWVHVAAAGVDTLLFDELAGSDVVVTNARGVFDRPIAEYVLGAVLAFAKDTHRSHDLQRERRWQHRETRRVIGATALVVGTGGIGRETARLLTAVGLRVRGAGRTAREQDPDFGTVVPSADLAEHVGWADHVVLVTPLTDATRGLVDARVLAAMRPGSHLVNVGRGPCVVESDLVEALHAGRPAGATLDVFDTEPLPPEHPLWTAPGAVVSAHMSGDVVGWRDTLAEQFARNALRWLDGEPLHHVVDKRAGYVPGGGNATVAAP